MVIPQGTLTDISLVQVQSWSFPLGKATVFDLELLQMRLVPDLLKRSTIVKP